MRTVACNLCGNGESSLVERAEPPYEVRKCASCGLVYTNPQPEAADIEEHYDEGYYREWLLNQMPARIPMWRKRLADLARYRSAGRLLDVGCGPGTFLDVARKAGFAVEGTELSPYASRYATETLKIPVRHGTLEEIQLPHNAFDVITFWHSLEHVADPLANLEKARNLLRPGGLLVLACPNVENYITRIMYRIGRGKGLKLFSTKAKELHLWHFSKKTFTALAEKAGFTVLVVKPDLAQIVFEKKLVDWATIAVYSLTGRNYGEAMKLYAVKEKE